MYFVAVQIKFSFKNGLLKSKVLVSPILKLFYMLGISPWVNNLVQLSQVDARVTYPGKSS